MTTLPLSDVINASINVSPTAATAQGFGKGLLLGIANALPLEERIREYNGLTAVAVDFATTTQEYLGAQAYFADRSPAKPSKLLIGNWFTSAQAGRLKGGSPVDTTMATWTAIGANGGFDIVIDGVNRQIFSINLSAVTTMAQVAAAIQTRLQVALAATTCTWDPVKLDFVITSPTTGTSSNVGYALPPTGGSTPTDISALAKLTVGSPGVLSVNGIALESVTDALNASQLFNPSFYGVQLVGTASTQNVKDAMAWAESTSVLYWFTTSDSNGPLAGVSTDLGAYAKGLGYKRTVSMWDATNPTLFLSISGLARMAVIDFSQPRSLSTLKFKQAPGFAVTSASSSQITNLKAKNYNVYVQRAELGGTPATMFEEGTVANGRFIDEVIGLDWVTSTIRAAMFNVLYQAPGSIPLTDEGSQIMLQALDAVLEQGVSNGLIARNGVWRGLGFGELKTGGFLRTGYYSYALPTALMAQADRDARTAPPITFAFIGAGAIHKVNVTGNFQR
jgi:hypothetical protein